MKAVNKKLTEFGLKPINSESILYFYAPLKGSFGYIVLGSQMMSPEFYEGFSFLLIPRVISLTNGCLASSVIGSALYLYNRPHMQSLSTPNKAVYSLLGSTLFNLGSVLGWALLRTTLGGGSDSTGSGVVMKAVIGATAAYAVLKIAMNYVSHVDQAVFK